MNTSERNISKHRETVFRLTWKCRHFWYEKGFLSFSIQLEIRDANPMFLLKLSIETKYLMAFTLVSDSAPKEKGLAG